MKFIYNGIFILLVFILCYILGTVGIDSILEKISVNYQKVDYIQLIGFGSSIVTLILFLTYIVGRYFLIKKWKLH